MLHPVFVIIFVQHTNFISKHVNSRIKISLSNGWASTLKDTAHQTMQPFKDARAAREQCE